MRLMMAGVALVLALAAVGAVALDSMAVAPPVEKVEQAVPDDHIPR
jgi:hypothetical protein